MHGADGYTFTIIEERFDDEYWMEDHFEVFVPMSNIAFVVETQHLSYKKVNDEG